MTAKKKKDGGQRNPIMPRPSYMWIYVLVAAFIIGYSLYGAENTEPVRSDWNTVEGMVRSGDVERIEVVNRDVAEVFLKKDAVEKYRTDSTQPQFKRLPDEGVQLVFNIGSVDAFREDLKAAEQQSGQSVPVRYENKENGWMNLLVNFLPWVLIIGVWFFIMRGMSRGGGAAGGGLMNVGKAKALKNRVSQYFHNSRDHTPKVRAMVEKVDDFDVVLVDSELEALNAQDEALQNEFKFIKKALEKANITAAFTQIAAALEKAETVGGLRLVTSRFADIPVDALREASDRLRAKNDDVVCVFASVSDGKITFAAGCGKAALEAGANAGALLKALSPIVGGGGGGRPDSATSGGRDVSRLDEALGAAAGLLAAQLGA